MITEELKQKYIVLVNKLHASPDFISSVTKFIQTYDGTNFSEFNLFMVSLIHYLIEIEGQMVKVRAFDKMSDIHEDFEDELKEIAKEFEKVTKKPPNIVATSFFDETSSSQSTSSLPYSQ